MRLRDNASLNIDARWPESCHHLGCLELGNLLVAVNQFLQPLAGMRPQGSADVPRLSQTAGEFDRAGNLRLWATARTWHFGNQSAVLDLRMFDRLAEVEHRFHAGVQPGEHLAPLGKIALFELDFDIALERSEERR